MRAEHFLRVIGRRTVAGERVVADEVAGYCIEPPLLVALTFTNNGAYDSMRTRSELRSMQHIHAASPSAPAMFGVGEPTRVAHSPTKIFGPVRGRLSYICDCDSICSCER